MEWPKVFTNPNFEYEGEDAHNKALADGLTGWGCCYTGAEIPKNFGKGMVKVGKAVGGSPTPDALDKKYEEWAKGQE